MENITITLNDGKEISVKKGTSPYEIAKGISGRLAKEAVAAQLDGKTIDLNKELDSDGELSLFTFDSAEGKDVFRHTGSHILAEAIQRLYPGTKLAIGPAIKDGFYYDFESEHIFVAEDFEKIEAEMMKIVKEDQKLERFELSRVEAIKFMEERNEGYKIELINDLPEDAALSFYRMADWVDLCAGPHLPSTKYIKAVKVMSVAGAYWRGDEKNKMLQRIYATAFPKKKLLDEYLERIEEAKKRDHRKLGKELKLFAMMEEGPGFPFFLPKGTVLKNILLDYWREVHKRWGYVEIETPIILNRSLWEKSGHWENYKENMYTLKIDEEDYAIKPMNCPGGMLVYDMEPHSYRDFPMRVGEIGRVHRHELSGALHGLMRVRSFTQDDAHIFMLPEQIKDEIKGVAALFDEVYSTFGLKYFVELSTKPKKALGSDEEWNMAETALEGALKEMGLAYVVNEGDGAFYGPKIDFHLQDSIGRTWQCGTIQLDFQLPQRFDLTYIGKDGEKHRPIVIHRVAFGSIERFIGIIIENFAGKFPLWISPEQVRVLTINDKHAAYAEGIVKSMSVRGIRVEMDARNEKIGYKIREAQLEKVPYMIIIGDKEVESETLSVRSRDKGDLGSAKIEDFIAEIVKNVEGKILPES